MTTMELISLSLSVITLIGVIVALFFGIRSIRENRIIQLVRYKNDLLEKVSNWLTNVQNLYDLRLVTEDSYSFPVGSVSSKIALKLAISKSIKAYGNVVEEGRNMFGIVIFVSKDLLEPVKSLEECLQRNLETFVKYTKLVDDVDSDNELLDIAENFDNEYSDNMKSFDPLIVGVMGKIVDARINMLDSIIKGKDPFRNV